ncbi:MAG: hypothetical protein AB1724_06095 [Thermodesulfobacteriota bacterium]
MHVDQTEAAEVLEQTFPDITASMDDFIEGSEADFMLLGIGLRTVHANVTELTELMLGTVKRMGSDTKGGFLDRGRQILNESMADIQTRQNEVRANLTRINALMGDIEKLHTTSKLIKKFAQSLKTVALTMLVENARTIDLSVNIFSDVALEIKDLSVNISGIAHDVYKNVEKAREVHRITREEISDGIKRLETLTDQIRTTVQESTHDTEELMRFSVDTIEESGRRSREISRQVAEIVVGVQFHDNMKQRLVKIIEILNAILTAMERAPDSTSPEGRADRVTVAAVIRELVDRLDEINKELNGVYDKNRTALKRIHGEVNDLLQGLRPITSDERDLRAVTFMNDPFSHLKDALRQLHDLLNRGETFYRQIQEAADQVADIASDLSKLLGLVRSISANTHNKAINSIIAANRQGEKGGALKLLAQAMNELATKSDGFSGEVENIITSIISSAEEISRKETTAPAGPGEDDFSITRLEKIMNDISLEYERFRDNSLAAYERAKDLKKATDTTLTSLDFFKGLSQRIDEFRDRLATLTVRNSLQDILIAADVTDRGHVPGKHTAEQKDNIILFEEARRSIMGNGYDASGHEEMDSNVELF